MKTRIIHTKIWTDSYFLKLTLTERYLFVYFLTNAHVNIVWTYECPIAIIAMETGIDQMQIEKAQQKFQADRKIFFHKDFVYLKNASKYEEFKGPTNETAKRKLFGQLSHDVLDWYKSISDAPIHTPLIPSITHNTESKTSKREPSESKMDEIVNPEDIPF